MMQQGIIGAVRVSTFYGHITFTMPAPLTLFVLLGWVLSNL